MAVLSNHLDGWKSKGDESGWIDISLEKTKMKSVVSELYEMALDGGWNPKRGEKDNMFFHPGFWKGLGKSCNWSRGLWVGTLIRLHSQNKFKTMQWELNETQHIMLQFHDKHFEEGFPTALGWLYNIIKHGTESQKPVENKKKS